MRTLYNMSMTGMAIAAIADQVKSGGWNEVLPDHDTRAYLVEKLDEAFYSVQSDITAAVLAAGNLAESEDGKDA